MKILQISFSDIEGGAAIASFRLHQGLLSAGVQSKMLVVSRKTRDDTVLRISPSTSPTRRIARAFRRQLITSACIRHTLPQVRHLYNDDRSWLGGELAANLPDCDLVHLHWVAGMVDYQKFLPIIAARVPLVWTLHDMNPFTGGCHYDSECGRFMNECGNCPMLIDQKFNDLSHQVWKNKKSAFDQVPSSRLQIITPSRWLAEKVSASSLLRNYAVSTIPLGLDLEEYAPRDKALAREILGIPKDARVVLFVAQDIKDKRKGYGILLEALKLLNDVFLLSMGAGAPSAAANSVHVGYIQSGRNRRFSSLVYSAADVFAIPSLEDNLPQTALEAMACGVPVVGFETGGIPESVHHGVTGSLVPTGDVLKLKSALENILSDSDLRNRMARESRLMAEQKFSSQGQAQAYIKVYEDMLHRASSRSESPKQEQR